MKAAMNISNSKRKQITRWKADPNLEAKIADREKKSINGFSDFRPQPYFYDPTHITIAFWRTSRGIKYNHNKMYDYFIRYLV